MNRSPIAVPQKLVESYRRFYRADKQYNASTSSILKPMLTAKSIFRHGSAPLNDTEDLILAVAGAIEKDLRQVHANNAKGYWVICNPAEERLAILDFARLYVEQVYIGLFNCDRSAFSSEKQIGLIEDTVEMLYRLEQDKENERFRQGEKREQPQPRLPDLAAWELSEPDENELLICGPGGLEIVIRDFNSNSATAGGLETGSELNVKSVKYPLEQPTDYSVDNVILEVVTVSDGVRHQGKMHLGNQVSWEIPYEFALLLQRRLQAEQLTVA